MGYYETGQDRKLLVDVGPNGLGLVLMQKKPQGWKTFECASLSLTIAILSSFRSKKVIVYFFVWIIVIADD